MAFAIPTRNSSSRFSAYFFRSIYAPFRSGSIVIVVVFGLACFSFSGRNHAEETFGSGSSSEFTLASVRDSLIRLEDTIIFGLIERARFPLNRLSFDPTYLSLNSGGEGRSIAELYVRGAEDLQAKLGRYQNPEEIPFFPDDLPIVLIPPGNYQQFLARASASVNASRSIWNMYYNDLLPLFTAEGDDGNYSAAVASDLVVLQALSRRIHFGRFVAEVKFRDSPQHYIPAIRSKDTDALMKLLTYEKVEEIVKKRVEKKAGILGQYVTHGEAEADHGKPIKVDPSIVVRLYEEWVIPLTKVVEVDYLLQRLN